MAGPLLPEQDDSLPGTSLSLNPSEDYEPSSTLQYVNSQLIAHGFARAPGLSIEGISNEDGQKLVKCIMAMLSQRMEDVGRTEQLGSKLRTLSYEHERLQSLNKAEQEKAANAEREMTLYKSKMTASQRSYTAEVAAHKQTAAELQRVRTALQYLRTTTQNELKRKEKELEKTLERWNKICDSQLKMGAVSAGLECANLVAPCEQSMGKGIMEEALEQAEEARVELVKENEGFRSVLLGTAHALQTVAYKIRKQDQDVHIPELSLLTPTAVFAPPTSYLTHPENAHLKIKELITNLKDAIADSQQRNAPLTAKAKISDEEVAKMQQTINSLRSELDVALRNRNQTKHTKYAPAQRCEHPLQETVNIRTDLLTATEQDALRNELDKHTKNSEVERRRFTEAAIKLGHERSELETERRLFLEDKRRWEVERMVAELPLPPPGGDPDLIPPPQTNFKDESSSPKRHGTVKALAKSPKRNGIILRSPAKKRAKGSIEAIASHRTKMKRESKKSEKLEVLYETENKQVPSTSLQPIEPVEAKKTLSKIIPQVRRNPIQGAKPLMPLVLPTSFTLPPLSPSSSLSLQPLVISSSSSLAGFSSYSVPLSSTPAPPTSILASLPSTSAPLTTVSAPPITTSVSNSSNFDDIPLIPSSSSSLPLIPSVPSRPIRGFPSPRTPRVLLGTNPTGMKKHDYSPAKPSPLSRILMIADSPPSPDDFMGTIKEEEEGEEVGTEIAKPYISGKTKMIRSDVGVNESLHPETVDAAVNVNATRAKKSVVRDKKTKPESRMMTAEKENVKVFFEKIKPTTIETAAKDKTDTALKTKSVSNMTLVKTERPSRGQVVNIGGARRVPSGAEKTSGRLL